MRWNCPHCGTSLALSHGATPESLESEWKLSACYRCGGFSMVNPQPRPTQNPTGAAPSVLTGRRSALASPPVNPTKSAQSVVQGPPPPPRFEGSATPPPPPLEAIIRDQRLISARRSAPAEAPADFGILRTRLEENRKVQGRSDPSRPNPKPSPSPVSERRLDSAPRQMILGGLITLSVAFGGLLYVQGMQLQSIAQQSRATATPNEEDTITLGMAAPERKPIEKKESSPRVNHLPAN